jgi:SAM-dependent methyltransferase
MNTCTVCGRELFEQPLLRYENMPKAAQFLPDADSFEDDKGVDLEVYQCSGCGLVQLSSDPVSYYRDVIRAAAFSEEMKSFRRKQFDDFVRSYNLHGKKVLEIGCGRGEYLSILRQSGVDAYGLEHLEDSVEKCLKQDLNVLFGFVESNRYKISHYPFDAFLMLNFLEHLPDPNATLRGIYNNMSDDAVGLVEVPNFDMILRKKLFSEFMSDHLIYFTKDTLCTTLVINGFNVLECNETWHDYIISAVVRKRQQLDISEFNKSKSKLVNELNKYISLFEDKKVAIWGASHQAFAVMALANLSGKVKFVVDSAVFKQGKYTPATHIPIVAPETLNSDPVDAVIVMAASYSDEVAMILRRDFDRKMHVAVLRDYGLEHVEK